MKKLNKYILLLLALVIFIPACKDEDLVILPEWESAVHGLTTVSDGSQSNFIYGDPSVELSFDMLWNSIDSKNTVTKIEVFILFNEPYVDPDGNPKTAKHGGDDGILLTTIEGAAVPANRETTSFTVSQDDVYALYNTAAFDYDDDGTETPVWDNPDKPTRDTGDNKFISGDAFQIRWAFTTADGRVFDSWGISVCTEFPGANCSVNFGVACISDIPTDGTWSGVTTGGAFGVYGSNPNVTIAKTGSESYSISDFSASYFTAFGGDAEYPATFTDLCSEIVMDSAPTPFGACVSDGNGTWDEVTETLTIPWYNPNNDFGDVSVFTRN